MKKNFELILSSMILGIFLFSTSSFAAGEYGQEIVRPKPKPKKSIARSLREALVPLLNDNSKEEKFLSNSASALNHAPEVRDYRHYQAQAAALSQQAETTQPIAYNYSNPIISYPALSISASMPPVPSAPPAEYAGVYPQLPVYPVNVAHAAQQVIYAVQAVPYIAPIQAAFQPVVARPVVAKPEAVKPAVNQISDLELQRMTIADLGRYAHPSIVTEALRRKPSLIPIEKLKIKRATGDGSGTYYIFSVEPGKENGVHFEAAYSIMRALFEKEKSVPARISFPILSSLAQNHFSRSSAEFASLGVLILSKTEKNPAEIGLHAHELEDFIYSTAHSGTPQALDNLKALYAIHPTLFQELFSTLQGDDMFYKVLDPNSFNSYTQRGLAFAIDSAVETGAADRFSGDLVSHILNTTGFEYERTMVAAQSKLFQRAKLLRKKLSLPPDWIKMIESLDADLEPGLSESPAQAVSDLRIVPSREQQGERDGEESPEPGALVSSSSRAR